MAFGKIQTIAAFFGVACLSIVGYKVFTYEKVGTSSGDPLAQNRTGCGAGDPRNGDDLNACLQLAYDLMGRSNVTIDDDAARALMKSACDHAFQQGCDALAKFDETKLDFLERRCVGATKASIASCLDAGRRREHGIGAKADPRAAYDHYNTACRIGSAEGCTARDRLSPR